MSSNGDEHVDRPATTSAVERVTGAAQDVGSVPVAPVDDHELAELFDELPEMVIVLDGDARVRHANRTLLQAMGYRLEDVVGTSMFDYIHPDDLDYNANAWENRQAHPGEVGLVVQGRGRDADGSWRAVAFVARGLSSEGDGEPRMTGLLVSMRELAGRAALDDSPARLRSLIDRTTDLVLLLDADGLLRYANRRLTTGYGHDHDRLVGHPWSTILHPDDRTAAAQGRRDLVAGGDRESARERLRLEDPTGSVSVIEWHGTNHLADPLIRGVIVNGRDVTHLVEMEQQLHRQNERLAYAARHDPLTGLLNRQAFVDAVERAIAEHRTDDGRAEVVVLFCDLDGFTAVNDRGGHEIGDRVLAAVGARLASALAGEDLVARYGGDEFTVLLAGSPDDEQVRAVIDRLRERIAEPIGLDDTTIRLGASIGAARAPFAVADVDALLRDADRDMYVRKRSRR
ncbi:MAG: diguanylate cyclase [Acidimicrobiales bacterium]